MQLATLDNIIRRGLLEDGLPIHWYPEFMFHSSTCVRELTMDTLQIYNSANLPVSDYATIQLPDDFMDDIGVYIPLGGTLSAIPKQDWLSPIRVHSTTTGQFTPQSIPVSAGEDSTFFGFPGNWGSWFWNINDYAEPTGRAFGANGGTQQGYQVFKSRRQIQLTDNFIGEGNSVVLLYISNGQSVDNATQIDWYAFQTIRAFTEWKRSPNANNGFSPEAMEYKRQWKLLRSRLNPLTRVDIINTFRNAFYGAIKN